MLDISAVGLTKTFGRVRAVDDVTFEIPPGRVVGFLGPNGSGKTTTLRILLGLVTPTTGRALIGGRPFVELPDPGRQVGAVLEIRPITKGRTVRNHLRVLAAERRMSHARVDEVLDLVDLSEAADRRAGGLSLGMKQRLSVAGALLGDPAVLILDEPTNGLDPAGIHWLRLLLRSLADEGRTVVMSSHMLAEVAHAVDDVVILTRGRLRAHRAMSTIDSLEDFFLNVTTDVTNLNKKENTRCAP